jgi:hypothetical protein
MRGKSLRPIPLGEVLLLDFLQTRYELETEHDRLGASLD